ncbi:hypothetical protein R3P38DRAFT_3214921 [Favolaschia claudopus]|uniref:Uncharacterized protein n=1 Tax=Favolaschia claudopus TaxID=2862362 RepID=A0AAW0AAZ3_9AGAR
MSPPFCYQPSNPDITGIGVRSSAYVSFFMSVLVTAYCATKFYSPPKAFASIRRARLYAYLAIVFASLIQGRQRQLSVFHSFAAAHLAQLILYAGFAEPVLFWAAGGDEDSTGLVVAFTGLFNIFYTIFVSIGWLPNSPAAGESSPYCTLDDSGANGYDGITWVVLLTIPTRNGWFAMILFFMPIFLISAVLLIVGAMNLFIVLITGSRKHLDAKSSSFPLIATLIIFLLIGVHEVVSIERSLMSNSGIDNTAEDAWSFGLSQRSQLPVEITLLKGFSGIDHSNLPPHSLH